MTPDTPNEERTNEAGKSLKEVARGIANVLFQEAFAECRFITPRHFEAALLDAMKAALEKLRGKPCLRCGDKCIDDEPLHRRIDKEIDSLRSGEALK